MRERKAFLEEGIRLGAAERKGEVQVPAAGRSHLVARFTDHLKSFSIKMRTKVDNFLTG